MAFSVEFQALLEADASINSFIDGGIYGENLEENFDLSKNWIVWSFNKTAQEKCMGGIINTNYNITLKIIVYKNTVLLEQINDYIVDKLSFYRGGNFLEVQFTGDSHTMDLDKKIYMNTLNFQLKFKH